MTSRNKENENFRYPPLGHTEKRAHSLLITWMIAIFICGLECARLHGQDAVQWPQKESHYQPQPYNGHLEPDDGQWIRPAKDLASTRYSSLDQINTGNVKTLKL